MVRYHNIGGTKVQYTAAEESARDAEEAQAVIDAQARADAKGAAAAKQVSGKQKLKDLGLDDDEIKALIGI
jgi:hypothetical protein